MADGPSFPIPKNQMKLDSSLVNKRLLENKRRAFPGASCVRAERIQSMGDAPRPGAMGMDRIKIRCVGNYDIGRTIGKGKFGTVKLATHVLTGDVVRVAVHFFLQSV